jgi:hypothetical protein
MNAPLIARVLGLLFLILGILALLPFGWLSPMPPSDAPVITLDIANRLLFALFPVNAALDALYIVLGLWGSLSALRFGWALVYCRSVTFLFLVLAFFGVIPLVNTLLGVAPIYGWDIPLHFIAALLAAYGGFGRGSHAPEPHAASGA